MSTQIYNAKASKARRNARRVAGACSTCGKAPVSERRKKNGGSYSSCDSCLQRAKQYHQKYRSSMRVKSSDAPVTTTGDHYLVPATGIIGKIMPCNCDNPIILEFADGSLDFFWLKEITMTNLPVTPPQKVKTEPRGFQEATLKKFVAIHSFLMKQKKGVPHSVIKQEIGSSCSPQLRGLSGIHQWNLMDAQIISRTKRGKHYFWKLTEFGRDEGRALIESLREEL